MIDWTQPIETTETPPRPVEILFDKDGNAQSCILGGELYWMDGQQGRCWRQDGDDEDYTFFALRNVAPPKPEPVLHERWVTVWGDGAFYGPFRSRPVEELIGSQVIRFAWMSDGSPVPGEDDPVRYGVCETCVEKAVKRCDELVAERDSLKAEVERLRPLYAAAVHWATWNDRLDRTPSIAAHNDLVEAVRAHEHTPKKSAEEAVANVAKMMGPVKTCGTCRWDKSSGICSLAGPFGFDDNNDCQDWEMKNG